MTRFFCADFFTPAEAGARAARSVVPATAAIQCRLTVRLGPGVRRDDINR
jgi:hypothetical protein